MLNLEAVNARRALELLRNGSRLAIRTLAKECLTSVPAIHAQAHCVNGVNCKGDGCRVR